jgi:glycosyltransferase involved in cell wall biosynthesis
MQVSVIIPVYHAASYLEEAVASALAQKETYEIVLVEDGSSDGSLTICERLASTDPRIKLYTHPGKGNLGASESRNLGIAKATGRYIAFLDADDVYLPERFAHTSKVFSLHPDADGVYEVIGVRFDDPALRHLHMMRIHGENTGLTIQVLPERLFSLLATGRHGHIHLNGIVVLRSSLKEELRFDPSLRQCQDSDWLLRISRHLRLYRGQAANPVAVRRVHHENRVLNQPRRIAFQRRYLKKCIDQHFYGSKDIHANLYLIARYVSWSGSGWMRNLGKISRPAIKLATATYLLIHPVVLVSLVFPKRSK